MLTEKDYRWIRLARKSLDKSTHSRYQISAVLIKGGRVIARTTNSILPARTWLNQLVDYPIGRHAECELLDGLWSRQTSGGTIYITGQVAATKNPINTRPCSVCEKFAKKMQISRIVYTRDITGTLGELTL
jgi:tRNA(Arg) A34 adenosine deaminase TadA